MNKNKSIQVNTLLITILNDHKDYICLTDIARHKDSIHTDDIIKNWLRNRNTIELLGFWEILYNPNFKPIEFDGFRKQAGLNSFTMTAKKWIEATDAIKENLIPTLITKEQINSVYSSEADMLNVALFGMTAKQWRNANPKADGNIRDTATIEQLVVLSNLESINSVLIHQGILQPKRLEQLNKIAITQMKSLLNHKSIKKLLSK